MDVFVAGGCSWDSIVYLDSFPDRTETHFARDFQETLGSSGSGKSLNLGRLGVDTRFHAMIGEDRYGEAIRDRFAAEPVDFRFDYDPNGTERHVNLMNDAGERISIFVVSPTQEPDIDYGRLERWVGEADALVVSPVNYSRHLLPAAAEAGTSVWADVHAYDGEDEYYDDFLAAADYLFMSEEGMDDHRAFMREQIDAGKRLVVCTRGSDGATALTADGEWFEVPAAEFELVDTNGAGDAFFAGYLYGHRQGLSVETSLRLGTLAGGLAVSSRDLAHPELSPDRLADEYERQYGDEIGI
ncbi:carbohydrate kinase family protein [Halapricum hydrolyticum]|uniref:Carbohydrate kinase family protein n=1 Tax=Halapricum hydrolyticum TaxID=2979991 RepID=A0AAE3ICE8_9EURY|nr:carbohydrate kinase family protein [Halapricum hydrolyticum]MCU4717534.1 carbohydrate kinase family protein [Halapricum hydrolyticum]MCU4726698.1 carbohydrate kinase family protein [Halapricum hydrolyticum]